MEAVTDTLGGGWICARRLKEENRRQKQRAWGMPMVMKQQQDEKPEKASEECSTGSVTFWRNRSELVFPRRSRHSAVSDYKRRNHSSLSLFLSPFSTWCEEMRVDEIWSLPLSSSRSSGSGVFSALLPSLDVTLFPGAGRVAIKTGRGLCLLDEPKSIKWMFTLS